MDGFRLDILTLFRIGPKFDNLFGLGFFSDNKSNTLKIDVVQFHRVLVVLPNSVRVIFFYSCQTDKGKKYFAACCQLLFLYELETSIRTVAVDEYSCDISRSSRHRTL